MRRGFSQGRRRGGHGVSDERPSGAAIVLSEADRGSPASRVMNVRIGVSLTSRSVRLRHLQACRASRLRASPGAAVRRARARASPVAKPAPSRLRAVECLSVCKRPCTVALAAPGKWTYVVGDLDVEAQPRRHRRRRAAIRRRRRTGSSPGASGRYRFRKGVVSRAPPPRRRAPQEPDMLAKMPVTIVTGFLGAGKTTLIRHLLAQRRRPPARAHHQRIRRRRRRRRDPEILRRRGLPGGRHRRARQRLHLLHRRRRFRARDRGAARARAEARSHRHRDLGPRAAEAAASRRSTGRSCARG